MLLKLSLQGAYLLIELVFVVVAILRQDVCDEQCCCRYCCFLVFGAGFYTSDGACCFFKILIALINSRNKNRFHHACFFPISGSVNNPYLVSRVYNRQNQGNNEAIVNCEEVTSCSTHPLISSFRACAVQVCFGDEGAKWRLLEVIVLHIFFVSSKFKPCTGIVVQGLST